MTMRPCIECGEPTESERCDEHRLKSGGWHNETARQRGYDGHWDKLSKRARTLQPFCSDCGATTDLQCDHTPEAWKRKAAGLVIRLRDVDVVCGPCNRKRGAARGEKTRVGANPSYGGSGADGGTLSFCYTPVFEHFSGSKRRIFNYESRTERHCQSVTDRLFGVIAGPSDTT